MKKKQISRNTKIKDPQTYEAIGKTLLNFGEKELKEKKINKKVAKEAAANAANYFMDAATLYGSKHNKIRAKENYKLAKKIYKENLDVGEIKTDNKNSLEKKKLINKISAIASIIGIIGGIISLFSNFSNKIQLSPGLNTLNWNYWLGIALLIVGIAFGLFWLSNKKK